VSLFWIVLVLAAEASPLEQGRALSSALARGDVELVSARLAEELRSGPGSPDALRALREGARTSWGDAIATLSEEVETRGALRVYVQRALHERGVVVAEWAFDARGGVDAFALKAADSAAPSRHLGRETRARLRLPVKGEWFVYWGGRSLEDNAHAARPDQRFALDLIVARKGHPRRGAGRRNSDYFAFGEPVLAPAAANVVRAVDGVPDNNPGAASPRAGLGNHVVLDLGNGEFAFLGHLQAGSLTVRPGAQVAPGQVLARCGNSGASTEPHLHFHLQDSPEEIRGLGLPVQFLDYLAGGKPVPRGEPRKGQTIRAR
jgi:murein DD-endopeptidase MepM/ murein hydrolase activator NlpD